MKFSVVIPTMRREQILEAMLDSIQHCAPAPNEVIVIDANSQESSGEVVTAFNR